MIHIKCAEINHQKHEKQKKDPLAWYRADCRTEFPFSTKQQRFQRFSVFNNHSTTFANLAKKLSTEIKKMMSRFKQVNQLFDQSENSIPHEKIN